MSQASRSRIIAAQRHRGGLARVIADNEMGHRVVCGACRGARVVSVACECPTATFEVPGIGVVRGQQHGERCAARCPNCGGTGSGRAAFARAIADAGGHFDVHRAREYAETLVHAAEENDELSDALDGVGFGPSGPRERSNTARLNGLARLGRRLLDALEGRGEYEHAEEQPDECQTLRCKSGEHRVHRIHCYSELDVRAHMAAMGWVEDVSRGEMVRACPDCRGTGHNLAGVLPPRDVSPQLRWRYQDSHEAETSMSGHPSWLDEVCADEPLLSIPVTRVVPRGEHRTDFCLDFAPWPGSNAGDLDTYAWRCAPKWLRGRLTHAQQRRERGRAAARRVAISNAAQRAG